MLVGRSVAAYRQPVAGVIIVCVGVLGVAVGGAALSGAQVREGSRGAHVESRAPVFVGGGVVE